jgi:Holliday junction resolvase RusA-like endonuclease
MPGPPRKSPKNRGEALGSTMSPTASGQERRVSGDPTASLVVTVPRTPPSQLLPNAARRTDWHVKSDLSRPLRELAKWEAIKAALPVRSVNGGVIFDGPVRMRVRVFWEKGRNRPDTSGLGHAVKAMEDGLTDAGIWHDDRQVIEACYAQGKDPEGTGYTEFTISAAP